MSLCHRSFAVLACAAAAAWAVLPASVRASAEPAPPLHDAEPLCGVTGGASFAEEPAVPVSLLQVGRASEVPLNVRINRAQSADERLSMLKPLIWVHIAKTGSGILNTLYNTPGICPLAPPEAKEAALQIDEEAFYTMYPRATYCPGSFNLSYSGLGHTGFGTYFEGNEGHAIAMFRQPEQRAISAYYWSQSQDFKNTPELANSSLLQYAMAVQGCQTKMLADNGDPDGLGPCVASFNPPTSHMVTVALYRLRLGFSFVGITEEWDLSICLFHAKFGGECVASEFTNTRPGPSSGSPYDTAELEGWEDPWDHDVYSLARTMFEEDLKRYGVSHESCQSWCYINANYDAATKKS